MNILVKNLIAFAISVFVAAPFLSVFDVVAHSFLNPAFSSFGHIFSSAFISVPFLMVLFALIILVPMICHEKLVNKLS